MRFFLFAASAALVAGAYGLYALADDGTELGAWLSVEPRDVPTETGAGEDAFAFTDDRGKRLLPDPLERADSGLVRYVSESGQIGVAESLDGVPSGATVLPGEGYGGADYSPQEAAAREQMRREAAKLRRGNMRAVDSVEARGRAAARLRRAKRAAARRATTND